MAPSASLEIDLSALRSILIVKPSSLGDVVHTLPLLDLLRQSAPEAEIRWLIHPAWAPLLHGHPLLTELIEYPRDRFRGLAAPLRFRRWAREQRGLRPDLAIDVQGLLRSAVAARAFRPSRLIGYSDAREGANWFHDEVIDSELKRSPHAIDRYLTFFQAAGVPLPEPIQSPLPDGEPVDLELPDDFVLLHPFSRGKGKSLDADQVAQLIRSWSPHPVVLAGRAEEDGSIAEAPNLINLLNKTSLPQLVWLLRRAGFVVSVDSGPMHLAAAITDRLLSVHTWSDPLKVGPYCPAAWVLKSGAIRSVQEFREGFRPERESTEISGDDVERVAEFVATQLRARSSIVQ